ncbi:MAG: NUDIX hydrolase [Pseudomonadota bacterium]
MTDVKLVDMTEFPRPILTVDVVLLTLSDGEILIGSIERQDAPFAGARALPGGYVHVDEDEDTLATVLRVVRQKIGVSDVLCEQLATYSGVTRDPRGWSATVGYYGVIPKQISVSPERSSHFSWLKEDELSGLAFDHGKIASDALTRVRNKSNYSTLPAYFLPDVFTLAELRQTYETVLGTKLNDSAFRRKIEELDILYRHEGQMSKRTARPAQMFSLKHDTLHAFDRRI